MLPAILDFLLLVKAENGGDGINDHQLHFPRTHQRRNLFADAKEKLIEVSNVVDQDVVTEVVDGADVAGVVGAAGCGGGRVRSGRFRVVFAGGGGRG